MKILKSMCMLIPDPLPIYYLAPESTTRSGLYLENSFLITWVRSTSCWQPFWPEQDCYVMQYLASSGQTQLIIFMMVLQNWTVKSGTCLADIVKVVGWDISYSEPHAQFMGTTISTTRKTINFHAFCSSSDKPSKESNPSISYSPAYWLQWWGN